MYPLGHQESQLTTNFQSAAAMESKIDQCIEDMKKADELEVKRTSEILEEIFAKAKADLIKTIDLAKGAGVEETEVVEQYCLEIISMMQEQFVEHMSNMHFKIEEMASNAKVYMVSIVKEEIMTSFNGDLAETIKELALKKLTEEAKNRLSIQGIKNAILEEVKAEFKDHEKRLSGMSEKCDSEKSSIFAELHDEVKRLDKKIEFRWHSSSRTNGEIAYETDEMRDAEVNTLRYQVRQLEQKILEFENRLPSNEARFKFRPVACNASPYSQIIMAPAGGDGTNMEKTRKLVVTEVVENEDFDESSLGPHPALRKKDLKNHLGMDEEGQRSMSDPRLTKK